MASPYSTQPNLPVVVPRNADERSMPAGATGTLFALASGFGIGALVMLFGFLCAIKEAFKAQLGTKNYNIEGEDGEKVVIEGSGGKEYSLVLVSTTVNGVKVSINHD
jgi:hypothetical protein